VRKNSYSLVASSALRRIGQIVGDARIRDIPEVGRERMLAELDFHRETLEIAFEFCKEHGPVGSNGHSSIYFREKLGSLISFARLAIDPSSRNGYGMEEICENVRQYSYVVGKLVAADLTSLSRRPASERTILEASEDNRNALQRLANK